MIILFIISSILTVALAQQEPSLTCNYFLYGGDTQFTYGCNLIINNPNGLNNFTEIGGIHLEGFSNADITILIRENGVSTNIPSIICDTFSNLEVLLLFFAELTEIGDSALTGCSRLVELNVYANRLSSISTNAFANNPGIESITLDNNFLTTLPENVFANQQNLITLSMSNNDFDDFPVGIFQPLENLEELFVVNSNLATLNNQWFATNTKLQDLYLAGNRIALSADSFSSLEELVVLDLGYNDINEISAQTFAPLPNLRYLYLAGNSFTAFSAIPWSNLVNLEYLDVSQNRIEVINDGDFRGLTSLTSLILSSCSIRQLNSNSFEDLENLEHIGLEFNEIEELPQGVFAPLPNLSFIGLWNNRLRTLHRNNFGTLTNLEILDLEANVVNALDRAIIDDAVNLNILTFHTNLCADNYFPNFLISRVQHLQTLERCFFNFRYTIDTITESDAEFSIFEAPHPGISLRVNTDNDEVQIALTPFNFLWNPMIEILIGTTNNTRSVIRINQETDVVTVPTPNIITRDQWNDFRVTWERQVVLVFRGNETFPFMGLTMQDFFPVNFYGLRAIDSRASWSIQPFQ